jgi:hypothetical protein
VTRQGFDNYKQFSPRAGAGLTLEHHREDVCAKPVPFGRKKGGRNRSREEREQAAYEKKCAQEWRDAFHQNRKDRKSLRSRQRQERKSAIADAARMERFQAEVHWTDEEWEAL